ncbi:MAG: cytochrome c oxidase subunit I [Anaerolineales bacterium]
MKILSLSLIRGIIAQVLGTVTGMVLVMVVRVLVGLPAWKAEPAWVGGALFGVGTFMYGTGVLNDWLKWVKGEQTTEPSEQESTRLRGWQRFFNVSFDHKIIGIQYGVLSLLMMGIAGIFAVIFRTELLSPEMRLMLPDFFNTMISLHGIVMIFSILLGVAAMSNYLVPLLIGANDMAFPRLNAFAFWINIPASFLLLSVLFLGGMDAGWTGYPPLSANMAKMGFSMFFLGVYTFGLSSILGSLNIIVTTWRMRAPGMTPFRMPILVWGAFSTAIIGLTATQLIALSFQLVLFERIFNMAFFDPLRGGNVILFQHLFWFYSHPAVYVFVLTGLGVISELLPVFVRKPLFGYRWVAMSSLGIALVGFFVWAHHMFASGMESFLRVPFMFSTLLVAVPTGVKFFSWVATIWGGKMIFPTPMLFVLGAISIFLLGGLSGPPHATVATNLHLHDTYFVVGHFHATMFGGFVFPFFAAIYYWFPKISGRMYNETLGKLHFWLMLPAFYLQSLGQMQVGLLGMRRRIASYDPALGLDFSHLLVTLAGYLIFFSLILFIVNVVTSLRKGEISVPNPWNSRSPEWQIPSPVPVHNYDNPIEVVGEPYDYGLAGSIYINSPESKVPPVSAPAGD